ncbi:hypothetical protein ABIE18_003828 [Arthrobacter sp. 2762]
MGEADDGADAAGGLGAAGSLTSGFPEGVPSEEGPSGPHEGPMFGTGGGVSKVGSTAIGPVGAPFSEPGLVPEPGPGVVPPPASSLAAGVASKGAGSGVVLVSGAVRPEGTLPEEVVPPPGRDSVAGRIWLDAATNMASAPASTIAAGADNFPTITPRMLVAPKYGRGFTCPGTIVPWGGPDNAWPGQCMGYF